MIYLHSWLVALDGDFDLGWAGGTIHGYTHWYPIGGVLLCVEAWIRPYDWNGYSHAGFSGWIPRLSGLPFRAR